MCRGFGKILGGTLRTNSTPPQFCTQDYPIMFHKEHSVRGRKTTKAMDVPLRKSDRRNLLQRAKRYFDHDNNNNNSNCNSSSNSSLEQQKQEEKLNVQSGGVSIQETLDLILDATFIQGNLSARTLPIEGEKAWNIILYLKTPSPSKTEDEKMNSCVWPYTTSSQFVWMAIEEKNKVVRETPTVALWAVVASALPSLVDSYAIWVPAQVSKFVCRGADLMRAGIRTLPQGKKMLPVVAQGNPQPFAVGQVVNPAEPFGVGTNGVGLQVWNAYGDDLWRSANTKEQCQGDKYINSIGGAPFDNGHYGNVGFQDGKWVLPVIDSHQEVDDDSVSDNMEDPVTENDAIKNDEEATLIANTEPSNRDVPTDRSPSPTEQLIQPEKESYTSDEILHVAVLQGLLHLKSKDLPMTVGTFYAQYVLPHRPEGTTIDLKTTTYKKFGQYLKVQMERGLLQAGPDKSNPKNTDPMAILTGYYKKHEDFRDVAKPSPESLMGSHNVATKLVMVSLYIIPNHVVDLMRLSDDDVKAINATAQERKGTGMLTATEARKIFEDYVTQENLISPGRPDQVQLDGPLTTVLYKNETNPPNTLLRKDIFKQFMEKLFPAYALVEMPGSKITKLAKGTPPKIEIEVSKRQSNKFITRVRGLEDYGIDATFFAKDVTRRLACSGTIETLAPPGRPALRKNHVELVFQGNIVDEIEALLVDDSLSSHGGVKGSEYSVPKHVVEITLRKGVPGRKKNGGKK